MAAPSKPAKKKAPNLKKETRTFFTYPTLHQSVAQAVTADIGSTWFNEDENDEEFDNEYGTCVMGRFACNTRSCKTRGWSSKVVAIVIRGYPGNGYNALVFNQSCISCNELGNLKLHQQSYVDRVAYRLKKWAGVEVEQPHYERKDRGPHESKFCEGCKKGVCPWTDIGKFC